MTSHAVCTLLWMLTLPLHLSSLSVYCFSFTYLPVFFFVISCSLLLVFIFLFYLLFFDYVLLLLPIWILVPVISLLKLAILMSPQVIYYSKSIKAILMLQTGIRIGRHRQTDKAKTICRSNTYGWGIFSNLAALCLFPMIYKLFWSSIFTCLSDANVL